MWVSRLCLRFLGIQVEINFTKLNTFWEPGVEDGRPYEPNFAVFDFGCILKIKKIILDLI